MTEKMKTDFFNLVDEWWLPVTLASDYHGRDVRGQLPRVSLLEVFEHGDKIVDLRCYPHERIALMRLLICIAQRALDGPEDENDWKGCRGRLASEAVAYLKKYKHCFNLFGAGPRFLQSKPSRKATRFSTQKFRFIDENGATLFDGHVQPGCMLSHAELAVGLVTFQSFAAGGRVEGAADSLPAGLCREESALHSFLLDNTLLETIWWNLVPKDQVLENPLIVFGDASWHSDRDADKSYLYRLAPIARHLWLTDDGAFVDGYGGQKFLTFERDGVREMTAAVRTARQMGQRSSKADELVSATAGAGVPKAAWRELHAIAVLRSGQHRGGPLALQHCVTQQTGKNDIPYLLWCGALIGGGKGRAAAVGDVIESVFHIPKQLLENTDTAQDGDSRKCPGPNLTYRKGVECAEEWSGQLQKAIYAYHTKLADGEGGKKKKAEAAMCYWTRLEQQAEQLLLHEVALNSGKYWSAKGDWMAKSPWGEEARKAAHIAYDFACPHSTPRQLRAYAAGLATLRDENRRKANHVVEADHENDSIEGGE